MANPEGSQTDEEILAQAERDMREEAMRVRRGERSQGATGFSGMNSKQEDAAAKRLKARFKRGEMPPAGLSVVPLEKEDQRKRGGRS